MSVRKVRDALVLMGAFIALIWILQVATGPTATGWTRNLASGRIP